MATIQQQPEIIGCPSKGAKMPRQDMPCIRQQPEIIGCPASKVTEKPHQIRGHLRKTKKKPHQIRGHIRKETEKPIQHHIRKKGHLRKEIGPTKLAMTREMVMDMYSNALVQWLRASGFTKSTIPKILQKTCVNLEKPTKKRLFPSKVKGAQTVTGLHRIDTVLHKNREGNWVTKEMTMKAYSIDCDDGEEIRFEFPMM